MNVLIITSWYPTTDSIYNGVFVKEQAKALKTIGMNPIVFYPYDRTLKAKELVSVEEEGIVTYRANTDYMTNSKVSQLNSIRVAMNMLNKLVKKHKIDVVHSHVCYPSGFVAAIQKKLHGTPYVITEHMSKVADFSKKKYNRILFKSSYKSANKVITVSEFLGEELRGLDYEFSNAVIGNVVDTKDYTINNCKVENDEYNIAFIGSMINTEVKGHQFFIPAFAEYIKKNPDKKLTLNLYADGVKRAEYEKLCVDLGIGPNCIFHGKVPKSEIAKAIEKNNFLVAPSIKETFGSVIIESMAGGKPVLATRCGGPNEIIKDFNGVLVEPRNIEALEKGLDEIINKYNDFDNLKIRNFVEENYGYRAIGEKLLKIYSEI